MNFSHGPSTNPFDSDEESTSSEAFQDCIDDENHPLIYATHIHYKAHGNSVLDLELQDSFSPLESALMRMEENSRESRQLEASNTTFDDDNDDNDSNNSTDRDGGMGDQSLPTIREDQTQLLVDEHSANLASARTSTSSLPDTYREEIEVTTQGVVEGSSADRSRPTKRPPMVKTVSGRLVSGKRQQLKVSRVLKSLQGDNGEFHADYRSAGTPWANLILVEDLGTGSSWAILLIPYIAFAISLFLDMYPPLRFQETGPINATSSCADSRVIERTPWLRVTPDPCSYRFSFLEAQLRNFSKAGVLNYAFESTEYQSLLLSGMAFSSGPIRNVPPASTFLRGDGFFPNMSTPLLDLVNRGLFVSSTVVLQRYHQQDSTSIWRPVFISKPYTVTMICSKTTESTHSCYSPRIVDVLFGMPGSGILSGDELQINVLYGPNRLIPTTLLASNLTTPKELLSELVTSSQYLLKHESHFYSNLSSGVRLFTLVVSVCFMVFWFRRLKIKRPRKADNKPWWSLGSVCPTKKQADSMETDSLTEQKIAASTMWWECPWILFPERRYLCVLLVCLMMLQNPILILVAIDSSLYKDAKVHAAADAIMGIGVNCILMLMLCLFQGLRYHTAAAARRRANKQFQAMELRRAVQYVTLGRTNYGTNKTVSRLTADFYERYGDVYGSGLSATQHIRLRHDPYGDNWADFLLPKFCLLLFGVLAVVVSSFYRFPGTSTETMTVARFREFNAIYVASSLMQLFVLMLWLLLIVREASRTGHLLRREPFLSTRPAQLAYRILVGILILGLVAILCPLILDVYNLIAKWTHKVPIINMNSVSSSPVQASGLWNPVTLLLYRLTQRFPYSGTAGNIGPGNILYTTVCALVACIIFLPSRSFRQDRKKVQQMDASEEDEGITELSLTERGKRRRDKRTVVTMARYTHSWCIFPLPIKEIKVAQDLLADVSFSFGASERSIAFFGKYTPVFCLEIACWLLEASWQAYYSPEQMATERTSIGRMSLESIGLRLEKAILDEATDAQVLVATNLLSQVDGEEDSIIVVTFRGTANAKNVGIDLKLNQVPLPDQLVGIEGFPLFRIWPDRVGVDDANGWAWESAYSTELKSYVPDNKEPVGCMSFEWSNCNPTAKGKDDKEKRTRSKRMSVAGDALVKMARNALPCVHEGFLETYSHVRKQVLECVVEVYHRQYRKAVRRARLSKDPNERRSVHLPKIYITGHSLGGSLGQLLALDLATNCLVIVEQPSRHHEEVEAEFRVAADEPSTLASDSFQTDEESQIFQISQNESRRDQNKLALKLPVCCYTYGQPRVGNPAFARLYKPRVPHTFRVVNEGDAVTTMPTRVMCGGQYKHAGLEVMLDEGCTGNILVGPTVVETMFRFTKVRTSVVAHSLVHYRENLESGLGRDELQEYYRGHNISDSRSTNTSTVFSGLPDWLTQVKRSSQTQ